MAPVRAADDLLGPVTPAVAAERAFRPATPVYCGIHDSNASLLPHLRNRKAPFAVVSTGTWVIAMAIGGLATRLDPEARYVDQRECAWRSGSVGALHGGPRVVDPDGRPRHTDDGRGQTRRIGSQRKPAAGSRAAIRSVRRLHRELVSSRA